ncbi:MAG: 3-hydroxyacyl-CoA dehydrogenase NAD-binding domain-containing protein [Anaerovoracaceae bacterium]
MSKVKAVFCGTGMIGAGLAANAILNDFDVTLYDVVNEEQIRKNINTVMDIMVEAGAATREEAEIKLGRVRVCTDLAEAVKDADFVQECAPENLELKKKIYRQIQEAAGKKCIIASSASGLFPSKLIEDALYPEKIVVGHPFNPSYLLPMIEICGPHAPQETIDEAKKIYEAMGKVAIVCRKEVRGYIANRINWAIMDAATDGVREGLCTVEEMDKAIMFGPGMRTAVTGQLLTLSLGVEGGYRNYAQKYGLAPDPVYAVMAEGIDEEIASRNPEKGQDVASVEKWRDKMFVEILKLHGMI